MRIRTMAQDAGLFALSLPLAASFFAVTNAMHHPVWFMLLVVLVFFCLRSFGKRWFALQKWQRVLFCAFSIVFAVTTLIGGKVVIGSSGHNDGMIDENYLLPFRLSDLPWTLVFALLTLCVVLAIISLYDWLPIRLRRTEEKPLPASAFFIFWLLIFLFWLPYLITFYPGMIHGDSYYAIKQALTTITDNHHPVAYILLLRLMLTIGGWFGSYNFGCLLYTILQMLFLSFVFAKVVLWLSNKGCNRYFCYLTLAFYALTQLPMYTVCMLKDPIFAATILLLVVLTFDIVQSKGEALHKRSTIIRLGLYTLVICFIRNNGIIAMIPYWLCIWLVYGIMPKTRIKFKAYGVVGLCSLLAYLMVVGPIYQCIGIYRPFVEGIAVPLQQIARVGAYHGDVTPEQEQYMKALHSEPYEDVYTPCCVDRFKCSPSLDVSFLNAQKGEFVKNWIGIGLRNPRLYFEAYVMQTYMLWSVGDMQNNVPTTSAYPWYVAPEQLSQYGITVQDRSEDLTGIPWRNLLPIPITIPTSNIVLCLYFTIALMLILRGWRFLLPFVPILFTWVGLLLSVPAMILERYMLPAYYALPFTVAMISLTAPTVHTGRLLARREATADDAQIDMA